MAIRMVVIDAQPIPGQTLRAAELVESRPVSAVSSAVGWVGLATLVAWLLLSRHFGFAGPNSALMSVFLCGIAMALWSWGVDKVHRNPSTGIDWHAPARSTDAALATAKVKTAGLFVTWALIGAAYGAFSWYWSGNYRFAMAVFGWVLVPLALVTLPYCVWLDRRMAEPRDGSWHFGHWLLGGEGADGAAIARHWRAWGVKGFFTAFMVSIVPGLFIDLVQRPVAQIFAGPVELAGAGIAFLYIVDVHLATVGYVLTLRPLDSHIRTANPYGMAWLAALMCYPPFVLMNPGGVLYYEGGSRPWSQWFAGNEPLLWLWGAALVLLTAIYAWATVAFGPRFSNLTHRGVITHGPYRFTRHPAYLAKNSFWWLASCVFLPWEGGWTQVARNCILLALVNGVYYWRAKTEERHLFADPAYRAYWSWAQRHALVPRLFAKLSGRDRPLIVLEPAPGAIAIDPSSARLDRPSGA